MALRANVGIAYHPNNWLINLNFSSGFKAPDLNDVARIYNPGPKKVVVPNENLKPEYLYNADLGIQYNFSNIFVVDFDIFFSYLNNAMKILDFELDGRDSTMYNGEISKVQSIVNSGNAIVYATSLTLSWQILKQLKFKQSLTFIESLDNHDLSLKDTPPLYGKSALSFEKNNFDLLLSALYNSKMGYDRLPQYERDRAYLYATDDNGNPYAPSWWIIDLYANYNFAENFQVGAGVNNILDYRYRPYAWGITAPGRNFILSIRYGF
jgi:hemoglobin/transferrin/lactoferrin receptor protein